MKFVFALIMTLSSFVSFANSQVSTVDYIIVRSDGLVYFLLDSSARTNRPTCAKNAYWMIKDENSTAGQQQYSMILSAHASGKKIRVFGAGTCSRWVDGEDVDALQILK